MPNFKIGTCYDLTKTLLCLSNTKIKRSLMKNPRGEDFSIKIAQDRREWGGAILQGTLKHLNHIDITDSYAANCTRSKLSQ